MAAASTTEHAPWVIVAGGVHRAGGTDKANFALVEHLLRRNIPVHVVTHRIDEVLIGRRGLQTELVPVPGRSWFLGEKLLSITGRRLARMIVKHYPQARVVVNGGNCLWGDINWVHWVHRIDHRRAPLMTSAPLIHRLKHDVALRSGKRREARAFRQAKLIITNSELTRRHVLESSGIDGGMVQSVRLGSESDWSPAQTAEKSSARHRWMRQPTRPLVVFAGAIGYDNRKGLDILLKAWHELCLLPEWDAELAIAGDGRALDRWRAFVSQSGGNERVSFLGFTTQISDLLAAADLLVSPVRYESFGLNVQEALCRGVPAIVSAGAGVSEIYPGYLRNLLLPDPENVSDLVRLMLMWRANADVWTQRVVEFSAELRRYTWQDMADRFYRLALQTARPLMV
jgi:glycosyltransferase involved in cell wall biosynthesis